MGMIKQIALVVVATLMSTVAIAESKVVIFNPQAAILNTQAAQRALKSLETDSEYASLLAKFESLRADMQKMEKDAKENGMTWGEDKKKEFRKKMEYKSADLKLVVDKLNAEKNEAMKRIMQDMVPKAKKIVSEIVEAEKIGLVLDSSVAHYANPSVDITARVTDKLNKAK